MIRVIVADDQSLVRGALAALLSLLTSLAGLPELDAGIRVSPDDGHADL